MYAPLCITCGGCDECGGYHDRSKYKTNIWHVYHDIDLSIVQCMLKASHFLRIIILATIMLSLTDWNTLKMPCIEFGVV